MTKYESDVKNNQKTNEETVHTDGQFTITREEYKTLKNNQTYRLVWYVVKMNGEYKGAYKGIGHGKAQIERLKAPKRHGRTRKTDISVRMWQKDFKAFPDLKKAMQIIRQLDHEKLNKIISYAKELQGEQNKPEKP